MNPSSTEEIIKDYNIFISKGMFSIMKTSVVAIPMNIIILLYNHFYNIDKEKTVSIFYTSGKIQGKFFVDIHSKNQNVKKGIDLIDIILNILEIYGLGKLNIKKISKNESIIEITSNPFSMQFIKLFGKCNKNIESYICGVCTKV